MSLPEDRKPRWLRLGAGQGRKAHLVNPATLDGAAWCGMDLRSAEEAPYDERCKGCMTAFAEFFEEVRVAPPETVTETFVLTVTRPATAESVEQRFRRKTHTDTAWTWELTPYRSVLR